MKFEIPKPMKIEHDELHADLVKATKAGGQAGEAAKAVAKVLHNHFVKEEEYALPPLGLLVALSEGKFEREMSEGFHVRLAMTEHGLKLGHRSQALTIEAEDALIAALKVKHNHPEALISYVRKSNRRGDRRNPHRKE